jgi:D-arginine dehydrogenase
MENFRLKPLICGILKDVLRMTDDPKVYDFLIIGAGIAGASAGYELARGGASVLLCEMEDRPGYHTTGRSAATFAGNYGNDLIRAVTAASRRFFEAPPEGFCTQPLLSPRGELLVADENNREHLKAEIGGTLQAIEIDQIRRLAPLVKPEFAIAGAMDEGASDIDVDALLQGYLRGFRQAGGELVTNAETEKMSRTAKGWRVETRAGVFAASVVINAAGAWADHIAGLAGTKKVGLMPKRRTALTINPDGMDKNWPLTISADESWYFRPEAGDLLISPADETVSPPCDAQPDEMDIALCIDRIETATTLKIGRLVSKRAGLRSFVSDKSMVCGFAEDVDGFFWLAGQGGYGIQTAPAMARITAALANHLDIPSDIAAFGVSKEQISPTRDLGA